MAAQGVKPSGELAVSSTLGFYTNAWGSLERDLWYISAGRTPHRTPEGWAAFGEVTADQMWFWQTVLAHADLHRRCRHCGTPFGPTGRRASNGDAYCCDACSPAHPRRPATP